MRRKGIGAVATGAALLIAAVVGFVVVPENAPRSVCGGFGEATGPQCAGWSRTAYDVAKIATWALLIVGALIVLMGLIRYARPGVGQ